MIIWNRFGKSSNFVQLSCFPRVLFFFQVQERSERQAQELRSLRLQVQQEQETHMSERAALQQKVAALEATTQNAAEQASHFKAVQENGAQFQQTAQKLQKEVQVRSSASGMKYEHIYVCQKWSSLSL